MSNFFPIFLMHFEQHLSADSVLSSCKKNPDANPVQSLFETQTVLFNYEQEEFKCMCFALEENGRQCYKEGVLASGKSAKEK